METRNLSERIALVSVIHPAAARAAGSYVGDAIDTSLFSRLLARSFLGTIAGAGTLPLKWQHSSVSASSAAAWADISTAAATSAWASTSNAKVAQLELQLDQHSAIARYVRPYVEAVTSTWIGCVTVDGIVQYTPATGSDHADVIQTVVY